MARRELPPVEFERRVLRALEAAAAPAANARMVVAVSGGCDSVALLLALTERIRRQRSGWSLTVAHYNHRLRGEESELDAGLVAALAHSLDWPARIGQPAADDARPTSEAALRRERYAFLARVARHAGADIVLTAHHADDQAETVLHRVARGTGVRGLAGIAPARRMGRDGPKLVRPLLSLTRADTQAYLVHRGYAHRDDRSNDSPTYTRNRIRHRVLPTLARELNPGVARALVRLADHARQLRALLTAATASAWRAACVEAGVDQIAFDRRSLARQPAIVQTELVRRALRRLRAGLMRVGQERLAAAAALVAPHRGGRRVELPGGWEAARVGPRLVIRRQPIAARRGRPTVRQSTS
ncbi:MAG: tRNA lysidine(34) synthetase TilS [Phycisphaerae bacterium]